MCPLSAKCDIKTTIFNELTNKVNFLNLLTEHFNMICHSIPFRKKNLKPNKNRNENPSDNKSNNTEFINQYTIYQNLQGRNETLST